VDDKDQEGGMKRAGTSSLLSDDVAQACNVEETVARFWEIVFRLILSSNLAIMS
jgi:hypothetical protein